MRAAIIVGISSHCRVYVSEAKDCTRCGEPCAILHLFILAHKLPCKLCLLTLAVLDISYGCKGTLLSKLSPCNFFTTTVLIGALVVRNLFIHVQTSVQTD